MNPPGPPVFRTSLGHAGLARGGRRGPGVQLTVGGGGGPLRAELFHPIGGQVGPGAERALPALVRRVVASIVRHLEGKASDLRSIALDMDRISTFHRGVYEAARTIPIGEVVTYGELAGRVGSPHAARAVGTALSKN